MTLLVSSRRIGCAVLRGAARRRRTAAVRSPPRPAPRRPRRYSGRPPAPSPPARRRSTSRRRRARTAKPCRAACRSWSAAPCGASPSRGRDRRGSAPHARPAPPAPRLLSMPLISACGCGLRTKAACQTPGSAMSSTKRPRPRSSGSSSRRVMREPMVVVEDNASTSRPSPSPGGGRVARHSVAKASGVG